MTLWPAMAVSAGLALLVIGGGVAAAHAAHAAAHAAADAGQQPPPVPELNLLTSALSGVPASARPCPCPAVSRPPLSHTRPPPHPKPGRKDRPPPRPCAAAADAATAAGPRVRAPT